MTLFSFNCSWKNLENPFRKDTRTNLVFLVK